jgi:uncharacterized protein (DUF58 family)
MLDADLKRLLTILNWETKRKYKSFGSGGLAPTNRGRGIEFKEVRLYNYGDDTRYIDWNVTSRTGEVHVKEYYSEQDVPVLINIDISSSMRDIKSKAAFQLAFFLTLFHIKMGNKVRLILFSGEVYHSGKLLRSENDAYYEFKKLTDKAKSIPKSDTNYLRTLEFTTRLSPKFSICYWLSDFCFFDGFAHLRSLLSKWENYGVWIEEEDTEIDLPFWFDIFQFSDSEKKHPLSKHSNLTRDKLLFKECFPSSRITIRPELKLSTQVLSLFQRNMH